MWVSAVRFWSWGNCIVSFFLSSYLKQLPANLRYRLLFLKIVFDAVLAKARRLGCSMDTTLGPITVRLSHLPYVACVERYLRAASLGPCISH